MKIRKKGAIRQLIRVFRHLKVARIDPPRFHSLYHFGRFVPSNSDEQIDAEIDADCFFGNRRKLIRKQTCISIVFGIASHESSSFLKKVHVRESYEFHCRMRVAEGSPKKKEKTNKREESL